MTYDLQFNVIKNGCIYNTSQFCKAGITNNVPAPPCFNISFYVTGLKKSWKPLKQGMKVATKNIEFKATLMRTSQSFLAFSSVFSDWGGTSICPQRPTAEKGSRRPPAVLPWSLAAVGLFLLGRRVQVPGVAVDP